jgi:hypothetical protein
MNNYLKENRKYLKELDEYFDKVDIRKTGNIEDVEDYFKDEDDPVAYLRSIMEKNKDSISSSKYLKILFECIERGIKSNRIQITRCNGSQFSASLKLLLSKLLSIGSMFRFVYKLMLRLKEEDHALKILGYFDGEKVRIIISDDPDAYINRYNLFLPILVHELTHLFASHNTPQYISLYKEKYLRSYYSIFFDKLASSRIPLIIERSIIGENKYYQYNEKLVKDVVNDYMKLFPDSEARGKNRFKYMYHWLEEVKDALNKDNDAYSFSKYLIVLIWKIMIVDAYTGEMKFSTSVDSLLTSTYMKWDPEYEKITHCYQELITPSEVMCVYNPLHVEDDPNVAKMLSLLFR